MLPVLVVHGNSPENAVVTHANAAYQNLFGCMELGSSLTETLLFSSSHPLRRALQGENIEAEKALLPVVDGSVRPFTYSATTLRYQGEITGAVFYACDASYSERSERLLGVQYKVAQIAMEAENFSSAAARILEVMICDLEWASGTLWMVEESDRHMVRAARWPLDMRKEPGSEWSRKDRMEPREGLPGRVWVSGQVQWVTDFSQENDFPRSDEANQAGLRAACSFPILLDGKVLGVFELFHTDALEQDPDLLKTLLVIGTHVGQLARRRAQEASIKQAHARIEAAYRREHQIASRFQNSLWPREPLLVPGYHAAFSYRPVFAEADVGGDFFNLFDVNTENVALVIGDVGGKGLEAAVIAAWMQHALMALALRAQATPALVLDDAQQLLARLRLDCIVTVFFAILEKSTGRMTYCSAGHEPGLVWRAAGQTCERLHCGQPALVGLKVAPYVCHQTRVLPGDVLFLHTDGLSESGSPETGMLGEDGVASLLEQLHDREPSEILRLMCKTATQNSRGQLKDDIAMAAIRRLCEQDRQLCFPTEIRHCQSDCECHPTLSATAHEARSDDPS